MQRLWVELTSSKCVLDEYNKSSLNDIFLPWVNNDSVSSLLNLFTSMWEKWYLTDETKSSAFLTNKCKQNLQQLLETGDLLQNNKWQRIFVIQNSFLRFSNLYLNYKQSIKLKLKVSLSISSLYLSMKKS